MAKAPQTPLRSGAFSPPDPPIVLEAPPPDARWGFAPWTPIWGATCPNNNAKLNIDITR